MKNIHALLLTTLAATILSACGGGGGGSAIPPSVLQASGGRAATTLVITIPAASESSARQPKYVSPNTQSVTIASSSALSAPSGSPCTGTGNSLTCNTTGSASGCISAGGTLTCTFNLIAQVGSDSFTLTMFSGTNGTGSTLSSGTVSATVSAIGPNNIPVTLSGVVDSVSVALANSSPATGASATIPVTVTAKDPSGATIVGPGTYNNPITLTNSDTSGATTLSTISVSAPGTTVTLTYNGSASLTSAVIGATSPGIPSSKITGATLTPASTITKIASGSAALAIYTNSAGQTFAYLPSPLGLLPVLVSSGSKLGSSIGRHTMSGGGISLTPAPDACAADPVHVRLYCIAYRSNVVNVLDLSMVPATVMATYTTDASVTLSFTGGSCEICGVAYDAADNGVILPTSNGYELYSAPPGNALVKTIAAPVSENFGYNPLTNQVWSPHYPGQGSTTGFDLADVKSGKLYTLTPSPTVTEPDQGAVDNGTNIGITSEEFSNNVFLLPFKLATLDSPAAGQFADPMGQIALTSSLSGACDTMLDDIAVDSTAHLAFFTGEFCSPGPVGVAQLPASSGASPTISDWNFVNVPVAPDGVGWDEAHDPHAVATFNLPAICADCGAIFNYDRSYLAVVDLKKLLTAPRDTTDTHLVANTYDLICNNIITFIATDATKNGNSGCATASFVSNPGGASIATNPAAGFVVNLAYGANNGGVTVATGASTEPPAGLTIPSGASGTPVLYLSITPSADLVFASSGQGYGISTITVPAWFPTGKSYNYYAFDLTTGTYCGSSGTGTLSGSTVTFASGGSGPSGSTAGTGCIDGTNRTTPKNHQMEAVFTYQ